MQISIARRSMQELKYHPKNKSFSAHRRIISKKHNSLAPFLELDFQNLILHSCILLNRSLTVSRALFKGGSNLPSFTSFSKHKEFFAKKQILDKNLEVYGRYIRERTDWFEIPLLILRDKYLMHASEEHMSCFGWPGNDSWNLELTVILPNEQKKLHNIKIIRFNPRRLARDIYSHFKWVANFVSKNAN
jgi:hypothetical protein